MFFLQSLGMSRTPHPLIKQVSTMPLTTSWRVLRESEGKVMGKWCISNFILLARREWYGCGIGLGFDFQWELYRFQCSGHRKSIKHHSTWQTLYTFPKQEILPSLKLTVRTWNGIISIGYTSSNHQFSAVSFRCYVCHTFPDLFKNPGQTVDEWN